ncbi:hypothetical protein RF11_00691 [Thelohanellus kitauei]|uniref:DH domain-containing protein n=1 Tax=Thelohanellus kitauei TaxID=669202 RepID=A0A0C2JYM3_THEKT|nr:hypothetical protein RF11_00691 [Thelohanellus kitauei]
MEATGFQIIDFCSLSEISSIHSEHNQDISNEILIETSSCSSFKSVILNEEEIPIVHKENQFKLQSLLHELITTENSYRSDISIIFNAFYIPFKQSNIIQPNEVDEIFLNLFDLIYSSEKLTDELGRCWLYNEHQFEYLTLPSALQNLTHYLTPYIDYCARIKFSLQSYISIKASRPDVLKFEQANEAAKNTEFSKIKAWLETKISEGHKSYLKLIEPLRNNTRELLDYGVLYLVNKRRNCLSFLFCDILLVCLGPNHVMQVNAMFVNCHDGCLTPYKNFLKLNESFLRRCNCKKFKNCCFELYSNKIKLHMVLESETVLNRWFQEFTKTAVRILDSMHPITLKK